MTRFDDRPSQLWPVRDGTVMDAMSNAMFYEPWERGGSVRQLEQLLSHRLKGHAVCTTSGTAALALALEVLTRPGSRVGVPAYTWTSVYDVPERMGMDPVLIDCDPECGYDHMQSHAESIECDFLIETSLFGRTPRMSIERRTPFVFDACQCFSLQRPMPLPCVVSFNHTKIAPSFGGGAVIFENESQAVTAAAIIDSALPMSGGWTQTNLKMNTVTAAVALANVVRAHHAVSRGFYNWRHMNSVLPQNVIPGGESYCHKVPILVHDEVRDRLLVTLETAGVPFKSSWSKHAACGGTNAARFSRRAVFLGTETLPVHQWSERQVELAVGIIMEHVK